MLTNLKQPKYTGINRCYPCTILNVGLLAALGILTAFTSAVGALFLIVVGGLSIWLRGYFVPFTPTIGLWISQHVAAFTGHSMPNHERNASVARSELTGDELVELLLRENVLYSEDGNDLCLSRQFKDDWWRTIRDVRTRTLDEFAVWARSAFQDSSVETVEAKEQPWAEPYVVVSFQSGEEAILRYPKAVAEFTAFAALDSSGLDPDVRLQASGPLRGFLTECPICDTPLVVSRFNGCCGNPRIDEEKPGLVCEECRTVLYKYP